MSCFLAWIPDPNRLAPDGATLKSVLGESPFAPVSESRRFRWGLPALSKSILAP